MRSNPWPFISLSALAAGVIAIAGTKLAGLAGLGEAITGTVLLGVITSLPGVTASVTATIEGNPSLAVANAMGGIAVQTAFLAVADLFHRGMNLEHAAASVQNILLSAILIGLLALVALTMMDPR